MTDDHAQETDRRFSIVALVATIAVLLSFISIGVSLQLSHRGAGPWLSSFVVFLGVPFIALSMAGFAPMSSTTLKPLEPKLAALGFAVGAANFVAFVIPIQTIVHSLAPKRWLEIFDSTSIFARLPRWELALVIASVSIAAPICEEFLFRGVIQRGLGLRVGARAVVLTAVLFSAFHFDPVGFLARLQLGVLFGWLAWRTQSLWPAIGAHAANNLVSSAAYLLSGGSAEAPETGLGESLRVAAIMLGLGGVPLFALLRLEAFSPRALRPIEEAPRRRFSEAAWPFFAVTFFVAALIRVFDWPAVQLNWLDARHPVDKPSAALLELRDRARRGEATIEEYSTARTAEAELDAGQERP